MTGSLLPLVAASLLLVGGHFALSSAPLRGALVAGAGERGFLVLYSAVALAAVVWMAWALGRAPYVPLWTAGGWTVLVPVVVMPVALLLVVAGFSTPNPTAVGQAGLLRSAEPARGILRVTRNPVMWGIGLWALAHATANGDLASLVFFGSFAVLALAGTVAIDRKKSLGHGADWDRFAAATSNLPFAAIVGHRQSLRRALAEIGWVRPAAALVLYAAIAHAHAWLFGVPALPAS